MIKYLEYLTESGVISSNADKRILQRLKEERAHGLLDLARRPVQLKMIANVLPEWKDPLNQLSRTLLYDHFINILIRRESKKLSRSGVTIEDRRRFARALGWYMWTASKQDHIKADDIPDSVLKVALSTSQISNRNARLRELVVGCSLEFKPPDLLYFAHRSLQEFLVAEELTIKLERRDITIEQVSNILTLEIFDFVRGIISTKALIAASPLLFSYRGFLPAWIKSLYMEDKEAWYHVVDQVKPGVSSDWPGIFLVHQQVEGYRYQINAWELRKTNWDKPHRQLLKVGSQSYIVLGMHLLFLRHFPAPSNPNLPSRSHADETQLKLFLEELDQILNIELFRKRDRNTLQYLGELLGEVAVYSRRSTGLEFGKLRAYFADYYLSSSYMSNMITGGRLSLDYDLVKAVNVTNKKLIAAFKSIRDKVFSGRL